MGTKNRLHRPVDELPESELEPLLRALRSAPEDDEPETPEEAAAVQTARKEVDRGETVPWEDVRRRLVEGP